MFVEMCAAQKNVCANIVTTILMEIWLKTHLISMMSEKIIQKAAPFFVPGIDPADGLAL